MQGLLFDIKRFSLHDGPGIRTTVFLKGCPLNCLWCQNPESIKEFSEIIEVNSLNPVMNGKCTEDITFGKEYSEDELLMELLKDKIFYEESQGGITFSGGEPLIQHVFLSNILRQSKINGLHTAVDTSGYISFNAFESVMDYTDIFLYDIKLMDNTDHQKYTGVSNQLILENFKKLLQSKKKINVRIPLIPGITDTEKNLISIRKYLFNFNGINQIDLLPFNKIAESKYKRFNKVSPLGNLETQSEQQLFFIKSIFNGLDIKVTLRG